MSSDRWSPVSTAVLVVAAAAAVVVVAETAAAQQGSRLGGVVSHVRRGDASAAYPQAAATTPDQDRHHTVVENVEERPRRGRDQHCAVPGEVLGSRRRAVEGPGAYLGLQESRADQRAAALRSGTHPRVEVVQPCRAVSSSSEEHRHPAFPSPRSGLYRQTEGGRQRS